MYIINNIEYKFKDKYTLKDWGRIFKILSKLKDKDVSTSLIILLEDNTLIELLNLILDKPIKEEELFEEDFETITKIIQDFFSRKTSLIKSTG